MRNADKKKYWLLTEDAFLNAWITHWGRNLTKASLHFAGLDQ